MSNNDLYRCLIVDDEPFAREVLKTYIAALPGLKVIGECNNAVQALEFLKAQPVDLLFLDIQMPGVSGLDLIRQLEQPPKIILTTAYEQYALQAFDLDVIDYLLKPIRLDRFQKAVRKAMPLPPSHGTETTPAAAPAFLYFRSERRMVKVLIENIQFVESLKDYVRIYTAGGPIITKYSIATLEAMLPETGFIRSHRSFIVARKQIETYTRESITIKGHRIPIGRLYRNHVMEVLGR